MRGLGRRAFAFWAAPTTGEAAAVLRIALGILSFWSLVGVAANLDRWFGAEGAYPWSHFGQSSSGWASLLSIAPQSTSWLAGVVVLGMVASVAMIVGFWPRVATAVAYVVVLAFQLRNPHIQNGGDRLFVMVLAIAVFVPTGHAWSVDAWWRARRGRPPGPLPTVWSLRLLQLQIAWVYGVTAVVKLLHPAWRAGTVMGDVLESPVYSEWPFSIGSPLAVAFLTYGVLAFEGIFPIAVWWPRARRPLLVAGVAMHVGIDVLMAIPMFSGIMIACYAAFLRDDEVRGWHTRLVGWWRARQATPAATVADGKVGD